MSRVLRSYVGGTVAALVIGLGVGAQVASPDAVPAPCVPLVAVEYDGRADAWFDAEGRVVAMAPEEDSLDWCAP